MGIVGPLHPRGAIAGIGIAGDMRSRRTVRVATPTGHGFSEDDAIAVDDASALHGFARSGHAGRVAAHESDKLGVAEAGELPNPLMHEDGAQRQDTYGREQAVGPPCPTGLPKTARELQHEEGGRNHEGNAQEHHRAIQPRWRQVVKPVYGQRIAHAVIS